jgi:hypothetical protein
MEADNFGYSDEEFWSNPLRETKGKIPEVGLYLGAPSAVALGDRFTLPVEVRRSVSLRDSVAVPFKRYALLHAVDLTSNRAYAQYAVEQDNAVYPEVSPAKLDAMAPAKTMTPFLLDARQRLDLPWRPAELLLTVTVRDKVSSRPKVTLSAGASAYQDPALSEYLEKKRAKLPAPRPSPPPGDPLPAYVPVDGSPPLPKAPAIAISAERVVELKEGATCLLRGSFLLPVGKSDLVPPQDGERHTAVINVHFVLTGADHPAPAVRTVRVPVYGKVEAGKPAAGHFAFDLLSLFAPPERTETYFLYVFSREVMAGPQPFAFVARDTLPVGTR